MSSRRLAGLVESTFAAGEDSLTARSRSPDRVVAPRLSIGAGGERGLDHAQREPEFAMVDADDQEAAGVVLAGAGPPADDAGEVADVEGDHDSLFGRGQFEQGFVLHAVQLARLVGGEHVMAAFTQRAGDRAPRHVRVQQEPHQGLLDAGRVDRRKLASQLLERTLVVPDRLVYLVGELLVVGECQSDLGLAEVGLAGHFL